ncbi:MAG: protein-disulfide reductase DsbD domain-containing protein [Pseudomonadota bacterium]
MTFVTGMARTVFALGLALSAFAAPAPTLAAGASDWKGDEAARVRLIAGARMPDGKLLAGLEFDLTEGWKTYWRAPGDSGVPSVFDWQRSQNVKSVKVHWPAPTRFKDKYGWNNGYAKDFVFPIEISPKNPAEPVKLELLLHYGVCEELCIPGKADLTLEMPPEGFSGHQALIGRYLQMVPQPANPESAVKVANVQVEKAGEGVKLDVTLNKEIPRPVTLFVEGPSAYYFEIPRRKSGAEDKTSRFQVVVDGAAAPAELKGKELTFTAVQGELRLEQTWRLD